MDTNNITKPQIGNTSEGYVSPANQKEEQMKANHPALTVADCVAQSANAVNSCQTSNNGGSRLENRLIQDLYKTFPKCSPVLLPILSGEKKPAVPGWQETTFTQSQTAEWQHLLVQSGNIGILLGKPSGGICAIDVDSDGAVEPFLELNPSLRGTLITRGARGAQIWVKVEGDYPKLTKVKTKTGEEWGEWRADGGQSVVHGRHPDGMEYQRLNTSSPITVTFTDIVWPADLKLPWVKDAYDLLIEEQGEPYSVRANGSVVMNDYFFVERYRREHPIIWEPLEKEFYLYNQETGAWEIISQDKIKWQFGLDLKRAADETKLKDFYFKRTDGRMSALAGALRGLVEKREAFKKRLPFIHLANGMLDLQSDCPRLMSYHPDYYSRNICPIALDPLADCPRFRDELLRSALGKDDISLLQRWCGGVLLGINPAQRFLLLGGTAGGGKSTVVEIIEKVIGEQNVAQLRTNCLGKQFELYRFLGKTLLTGKEVNGEFLSEKDASVIKALVGNDLLDAEKKNGTEQFQLRGSFNIAITCNSRLRLRLEGDSGAWERRLMIIEYSKPKPQVRITEFADKLIKEEGAGILNWMIEGAIQYLAEVEEFGDIQLTQAQKRRVDLLLQESDSARQFVMNRVVAHLGEDVSVFELQQAYFQYCDEMGWNAFSANAFCSCLPDLMLEIHRVRRRNDINRNLKQVRGFSNVSIQAGGL